MSDQAKISSGVKPLDHILDGLHIGDNVVWHDDSGSLASAFCLRFIESSLDLNRPLIYVSFDRSPRNLLDKLGALSQNSNLFILDCFTSGKGASSPIFLKFYDEWAPTLPCQIIRVNEPARMDEVMDAFYSIHAGLTGDVRFVFESLTGMQELWGGEDSLVRFYSHSCPRLYELNTIAYWIMEKRAHSQRVRAQISQIAQVVIELEIKRGTTSLSVIKAENRNMDRFNRPYTYWVKDSNISFYDEKRSSGGIDLGGRLKELRTRSGLSQTDLARMVGVTPSTISQVESNLIYPSLPALLKMAEILAVDISSFFQHLGEGRKRVVFSSSDSIEMRSSEFPEGSISKKLLLPVDVSSRAEPYLVEIPPGQTLPSHFFSHKGEEIGYLLAGQVQVKLDNDSYSLQPGDIIFLDSDNPSQWRSTGTETARLLWLKVK